MASPERTKGHLHAFSIASPLPHLPTHKWSYRVPSPPRVVIPPPAISGKGSLQLNVGDGNRMDFESNGFANLEFLAKVTYGDCMNVDSMINWKYEQRRQAQNILPFLFLGPNVAARDVPFLQREGITMVMAIRDSMSAQAKLLGSRAATDAGIKICIIDVAGNQELIAAFPRAIEAINSHLSLVHQEQQEMNSKLRSQGQNLVPEVPGKVLVYCESGNERSAGVVVAYVMAMFALDLVSAIQIVQTQRFCVSFDDSLRFLLQSYEAILCAKRDVAKSMSTASTSLYSGQSVGSTEHVSKPAKRSLDEAYEHGVEMEDDNDQHDNSRFDGREGFAPFEDTMQL